MERKSREKEGSQLQTFMMYYTQVKTLLRMRGREVKTKVTPLLVRLLEPPDLSDIPAIKWGRLREKMQV